MKSYVICQQSLLLWGFVVDGIMACLQQNSTRDHGIGFQVSLLGCGRAQCGSFLVDGRGSVVKHCGWWGSVRCCLKTHVKGGREGFIIYTLNHHGPTYPGSLYPGSLTPDHLPRITYPGSLTPDQIAISWIKLHTPDHKILLQCKVGT